MDLQERGIPVIPHGIRLSLGGAEPLDPSRVGHLAACAEALDAPLVSEHIAFVRAGGEVGHLLPVPRTREALDVLASHVAQLQAELTVPVALEVIAALFDWPDDELAEPEFLAALLDRTDALLLLDVANVYANAVNRGHDPRAVLDRILDLVPADRIGYVHVAGGGVRHDEAGLPGGELYHDTHPIPFPTPCSVCSRTWSSGRRACRCCWNATVATRPRPSSPPSWPPSRRWPTHDGESGISPR